MRRFTDKDKGEMNLRKPARDIMDNLLMTYGYSPREWSDDEKEELLVELTVALENYVSKKRDTTYKWISTKNKMPPVEYDLLGNIIPNSVIIQTDDGDVNIGYYNPRVGQYGVFETFENGFIVTVASADDVVAWMPLPEPYNDKGESHAKL